MPEDERDMSELEKEFELEMEEEPVDEKELEKEFEDLTELEDLKGLLGSLAKAGLGAVVPGGGAILPALKALGFETSEDEDANRDAWRNYVEVSREAYEYLASNLEENADDPLIASRLANEAFQTALKGASAAAPSAASPKRPYRVIHVRKGDRVLIK